MNKKLVLVMVIVVAATGLVGFMLGRDTSSEPEPETNTTQTQETVSDSVEAVELTNLVSFDQEFSYPEGIICGSTTLGNTAELTSLGDEDIDGSVFTCYVEEDNQFVIRADIQAPAVDDTVYEGWLVDADTGDYVALGEPELSKPVFENDVQTGITMFQHLAAERDYTDFNVYVITREAVDDEDSSPGTVVAQARLTAN